MIYFWKTTDKYGIFSQWYKSDFKDINDIKYNCAEQFMMYQKAILFGDNDVANEILNETDPKNIKALGRKIKNFNQQEWDENKFEIVIAGNFYKFTQNNTLRDILLNTKDEIIAEASPFDKIWGIGLDEKIAESGAEWKGENLLGKALMVVRDIIGGSNKNYDKV